jgi:HK97 family phage major capsid protein
MTKEEITEKIDLLNEAKQELNAKITREGRNPNQTEEDILNEINEQVLKLQSTPLSCATGLKMFTPASGQFSREFGAAPYTMIAPNGRKDWKSMFGNAGYEWPDKETNFFQAAFSGRYHPGLIKNAMTEGIPSSGGFLVPTEQADRIHTVSLENELVMPRAYVQPMNTNELRIPAMVIGSHSTALFGGFTASYTGETGTIDENSPKARSMTLIAKKLTGLIRFSSELNADTPAGMGQIENLCGKGLAWYRDKAFLKGTGAGEPLGILNASSTIEVDPETGQDSGTIIYENITAMMSRMFAGSFANSVWVCHQSTIPQLLQLSVQVGLAGNHIPVMTESDGVFKILTRPCVFTEKTEALGNRGDIMLCDFSQYVVGLRAGMQFETSIHVHFTTDELLSRIIERHDGQPLWGEALTLEDGSTTVSPFVVLGAR